MDVEMPPQELELYEHVEDGKKWVAEIIGEDPTFKVERSFLSESEANIFKIYDGYYQIHGKCPGVSPFIKEYCMVKDGRMTRRLHFRDIIAALPEINDKKEERTQRIKQQILSIFDEVYNQVPHERVEEELLFQREQVDMTDDESQLRAAYRQLNKQKDDMINHYKKEIEKWVDE